MSKKNKGFTLIEIIVVLVILAILAAATIPSMLGFVKKSREKSIIPEARAAYTAAQTIATEKAGMAKEITEAVDNDIMIAIAGGSTENNNIGNAGLKVTRDENGNVTEDSRTDRMKALLGSDAEGQVEVKVKNGRIKYFYYKKEIGNETYDFTLINSDAIAEYEVTE